MDLLASEYGWTTEYVLDRLTRAQVELYLDAMTRRYKRQSDALRSGSSDFDRNFAQPADVSLDDAVATGRLGSLGIPVELG